MRVQGQFKRLGTSAAVGNRRCLHGDKGNTHKVPEKTDFSWRVLFTDELSLKGKSTTKTLSDQQECKIFSAHIPFLRNDKINRTRVYLCTAVRELRGVSCFFSGATVFRVLL